MSSTLVASERSSKEHVAFEQRLFQSSPVGTAATAALIFVLAAGSFVLIATLFHYPLIGAGGSPLAPAVAPAFVLSLLVATALGMNRYATVKLEDDAPAFAAIVSGSAAAAADAILRPASTAHRSVATVAGGAAGAALTFVTVPQAVLHDHLTVFAWFATFEILLGMMFGRGIVMASRNARRLRHIIESGIRIDLLHSDRLDVIGRQSARSALVWFTIAAVICLFFVGGELNGSTLSILGVCIGIGLWTFLRSMVRVHRRIRAAKSVELDRIRDEIVAVSATDVHDAAASARLQGLIAYEARIQAVREWPFDHSTLMRIGIYVFFPAMPWIGKAMVVSDLLQRLAH